MCFTFFLAAFITLILISVSPYYIFIYTNKSRCVHIYRPLTSIMQQLLHCWPSELLGKIELNGKPGSLKGRLSSGAKSTEEQRVSSAKVDLNLSHRWMHTFSRRRFRRHFLISSVHLTHHNFFLTTWSCISKPLSVSKYAFWTFCKTLFCHSVGKHTDLVGVIFFT